MARAMAAIVSTFLASYAALGQPAPSPLAFEVASVKSSKTIVGHDGNIKTDPGRFIAANATLLRLIFEAYQIPYAQITGGPAWLKTYEFDIDAKAETPVGLDQLRLMLRALLADRFKLSVRTESVERRVYALVVGKDGPRLNGVGVGAGSRTWRFHGSLSEFANILAIQLTIPMLSNQDPSVPSRASGAPVPVIDKTGIDGVYDIAVDINTDRGGDAFAVWQRALQEQLGLKLESQKAPVAVLIIDHAERIPARN
jgi:uncharacterized protein (TIGR03435 family)